MRSRYHEKKLPSHRVNELTGLRSYGVNPHTLSPAHPLTCPPVSAFTLVEMMVAVCILAVGITLVGRSFITTVSVMDSLQTRIEAFYLLGVRMNELEELAFKDNGIETGESQEEITLGKRKAVFKSEVKPLDEEGFEDINQVKLRLVWQEGAFDKDAVLVTYLPGKK